jgi:FixJ family two-component response regulator
MTGMSEMAEIVYVVDDDASVRTGLGRLLRAAGFAVEAFDSAEAFLARGQYEQVACLVLDVHMPGLDGLALQAQLSARQASLPIVFLTGVGDIPMSVAAMKQGACDFLTKPVDETVLLDAIRQALARQRADIADGLAVNALRARLLLLTPREGEVLRWVIGGALNKQIAAQLGIAEKTVKIHRGRVMEKLAVGSIAELVSLCQQAGVRPVQVS